MKLHKKNISREIDLFDFTSFFGLDFFKFSGLLCDTHQDSGFRVIKTSGINNELNANFG